MNFIDELKISRVYKVGDANDINVDKIILNSKNYLENNLNFEQVTVLDNNSKILFKKSGLMFLWRKKDFIDNGTLNFSIEDTKLVIVMKSDMKFALLFIVFGTVMFASVSESLIIGLFVFTFFYTFHYISRYIFLNKLTDEIYNFSNP